MEHLFRNKICGGIWCNAFGLSLKGTFVMTYFSSEGEKVNVYKLNVFVFDFFNIVRKFLNANIFHPNVTCYLFIFEQFLLF